jgi:hypothetical protein
MLVAMIVLAGARSLTESVYAMDSKHELVGFRSQLQKLKKLHYEDSDTKHVIVRYEQLIQRFENYPDVAEAKYHLARYYRTKDISKDRAIHWFRAAIRSSETNNWVWSKARIGLAGQLRWMTDDPKAVREARTLIEEIAALKSNDVLTSASVEFELMMQCIVEENFAGAERHCCRLMEFDNRKDLPPLVPFEEQVLEATQSRAVEYLVQKVPHGPGTQAGKTAWVEEFAKKYPECEWLQAPIRQARVQIDNAGDPAPTGSELLASSGSTARTILLSGNLIVVIVLGMLVLKNRLLSPARPT